MQLQDFYQQQILLQVCTQKEAVTQSCAYEETKLPWGVSVLRVQKKKEVQGLTWGTCVHKSISTKILSLRFMAGLCKPQIGVVMGIAAKVPKM